MPLAQRRDDLLVMRVSEHDLRPRQQRSQRVIVRIPLGPRPFLLVQQVVAGQEALVGHAAADLRREPPSLRGVAHLLNPDEKRDPQRHNQGGGEETEESQPKS